MLKFLVARKPEKPQGAISLSGWSELHDVAAYGGLAKMCSRDLWFSKAYEDRFGENKNVEAFCPVAGRNVILTDQRVCQELSCGFNLNRAGKERL